MAGAGNDADEVLELSNPMPGRLSEPAAPTSAVMDMPVPENAPDEPDTERDPFIHASGPEPVAASEPEFAKPEAAPEPAKAASILSPRTAEVSRSALDTLSRIVVKPETGSDGTLESLVREMLRPMLRDWLDANLPAMVETMVQAEIARITGRRD